MPLRSKVSPPCMELSLGLVRDILGLSGEDWMLEVVKLFARRR
jgi:hypothetical protein